MLFVEESMFLDPEARIYFLQCASFGGVDLLDPEAQIYYFAVHSLQWGRSLWPWGISLIFAVDHSLTSRLWACWVLFFSVSTLTCFCVCFRVSSFPLESFPASKMVLVRPSIPLLGHWPKWSSFGLRTHASPLLWLVAVGSPSSDMTPVCHSGLSRSRIQNSSNLWKPETRYPLPVLSLFLFLEILTTFDLAHYCPVLKDFFLFFYHPQKASNLSKNESFW